MDPSEKRIQDFRHQLTLEALADVEAGRVVDHSIVQKWADRLQSDDERDG